MPLELMTPFAFYQLVLSQCDEQPDLSLVQQPLPCPEAWPLLFKGLVMERRRAIGFDVCDGQKRNVRCTVNVPDVLNKLASLEPGAIIHLMNGQPKYDATLKAYALEVDNVATLKEYNDLLAQQQRVEAARLAQLKQQMDDEGFFEQIEQVVYTGQRSSGEASVLPVDPAS
jgi:hypothetical protein